jgi:hypothetical protein
MMAAPRMAAMAMPACAPVESPDDELVPELEESGVFVGAAKVEFGSEEVVSLLVEVSDVVSGGIEVVMMLVSGSGGDELVEGGGVLVSGPKMVVSPTVLTTTMLDSTRTVERNVTVVSKRAWAPALVAVVTVVISSPSAFVPVRVSTWSALETMVDNEVMVDTDSTVVGIVVVITIGEVAMGIEFWACASWRRGRRMRGEVRCADTMVAAVVVLVFFLCRDLQIRNRRSVSTQTKHQKRVQRSDWSTNSTHKCSLKIDRKYFS